MPNCEHSNPSPADGPEDHDWCLATRLCRRCGASEKAVAAGIRANYCEPGVVGISWVRASERLRDLIEGPAISLPLYRLGDLVPTGKLTGKVADFIVIDDPPPSAA